MPPKADGAESAGATLSAAEPPTPGPIATASRRALGTPVAPLALALLALLAFLTWAPPLEAGGPLVYDNRGDAVTWGPGAAVPYSLDPGGLGTLDPAAAAALVEELLGVWQAVPTSTLAFQRAGDLPVDVDAASFGPYLGSYGGATRPLGTNAVVFDHDGTIFDALFGVGTRVAGFAGPTFFSDGQRTYPADAVPPPGSRIVEGLVFLNGRFLDGVDTGGDPELGLAELRALVVHELGHFAGLGHTQIDGVSPPSSRLPAVARSGAVETMFPYLVDPGQATLERDDVAALSSLYPTPEFTAGGGCFAGRVRAAEGAAAPGVNVVARNLDDGRDAVSTVTDSVGAWRLCGLAGGARYRIEVSEVDVFHTAGRRVGPFSPPLPMPGAAEAWSGDLEGDDPALDDPAGFAPVIAEAGRTVSGLDVVLDRQRFRVRNVTLADDRSPLAFAPGDFDGDGALDFVAVQEGTTPGNVISFHRGRGNGDFAPARTVDHFAGNARVVAGQFNAGQDDHLDVAVASTLLKEVRLYLGDGQGGFGPGVPLVTAPQARTGSAQLAAGDLDGDRWSDLLFVVEESAGGLTVHALLGGPAGVFTPVVTEVPASAGLRLMSGATLALAPFAPGAPASAVFTLPAPGAPGLGLLAGDGSGRFQPRRLPLKAVEGGLAAGDLDGDGDLDLAVAGAVLPGSPTPTGPAVALLRGDGRGGFALAAGYPVPEAAPTALAIDDYDLDGIADVASTGALLLPGSPGAALQVAFGDGAGGVREIARVWGLAEFPRVLAGGDFDGDGRPDLLTSGKRHGLMGLEFPASYSVLLNSPAGSVCEPSDHALCLNGGRFRVEMQWQDFEGAHGVGHAVPLTADTGYFWFFQRDNLELVVKVLDGGPVNGKYWVFSGALSNVEYTLVVTDTATGASKVYRNPAGQFGSFGDTAAFPAAPVGTPRSPAPAAAPPSAGGSGAPGAPAATPSSPACTSGPRALCLQGGRFRVEVDWHDFQGGTGAGTAVPLTADSGTFWFFNPANVELAVKVLDGRPVNGRFWVFFGALTNVEYSLTVTDTVSGQVRRYVNPAHRFASHGDTAAF